MKNLFETIPMFLHGTAFTIPDANMVKIKYGQIREQMTLTETGWVFADSPKHIVKIDREDFDRIMLGWSKVFDDAFHGTCVITIVTKRITIKYKK